MNPSANRGTSSPRFGFNLIGYASANLGLGVAFRNTVAALVGSGYPFCVVDVDPGGGRSGHDHSLRERYHDLSQPLPYPVNVYHLNPPELAQLLNGAAGFFDFRQKMNVCVPFWELADLPPLWAQVLEAMDLVLAPSQFIHHTLSTQLSNTSCRYFRQGLNGLPEVVPDRRRWGISDSQVAFLYSYDATSDIHRKNPAAVVNAFARAFAGTSKNILLIKINNTEYSGETLWITRQFKAAAGQLPNVRILDQVLTYPEVLSLYRSIDVYVSLHRGEGLGLSLMECMALGKPVIATAWSGNMDFMDDSNSCLVRHKLIPVASDSAYYFHREGASSRWADPLVDDAIRWMVRLARDAALRQDIGARARETIRTVIAEAMKGAAFATVRAFYNAWSVEGNTDPPE